MSDPTLKSARVIAAEVLQRFDLKHAHAGPILERLLKQTEERQRATDLVFGTIRNLGAIDRVVEHFAGRPVARIDKMLRAIIRVGVYELLYAPDTPVYSIVNEAVNGAGQTGGKKQTGFVNAVLRGIERHIVRARPILGSRPRRGHLSARPRVDASSMRMFCPIRRRIPYPI